MRNLLRLPAVSLLALTLFVGCSDDDEKEPAADASPTASAAEPEPTDETRSCRSEVTITGAAEAAWSGKATVRVSSNLPKAVYQAASDDAAIAVYSPLDDGTANANVTVNGVTYTTPFGDDTGLKVAEDGSGAAVAATASGVGKETVTIDATFQCGKGGKG